jgi:hypothetical protein
MISAAEEMSSTVVTRSLAITTPALTTSNSEFVMRWEPARWRSPVLEGRELPPVLDSLGLADPLASRHAADGGP